MGSERVHIMASRQNERRPLWTIPIKAQPDTDQGGDDGDDDWMATQVRERD